MCYINVFSANIPARVVTIYRYDDINTYNYRTCTFVYLWYWEKTKDAVSHLRLDNNFPLNCSLAPPHVQRRHQRQRPLSLISIPRPNINQNWQYGNNVNLNIEKTNAYLSSRIDAVHKNCGHKAAAKRGNTSNMFTYISEHHPSVQIQLCPIYNLRLNYKALWFPWCGVNPRIQSWQWIYNADVT